jgi:hypothetical protein
MDDPKKLKELEQTGERGGWQVLVIDVPAFSSKVTQPQSTWWPLVDDTKV